MNIELNPTFTEQTSIFTIVGLTVEMHRYHVHVLVLTLTNSSDTVPITDNTSGKYDTIMIRWHEGTMLRKLL